MIRGLEFGEHSGMGLKDMGNLLGDKEELVISGAVGDVGKKVIRMTVGTPPRMAKENKVECLVDEGWPL